MSSISTLLVISGVILIIFGILYVIGSFATLSGVWIIGVLPILVGWLLISIGKDKAKKEKKNENIHYNSNDSLEILKERYAKGEITSEEYKRMKKDLE
jgi:putative membrane protein